MPNHPVHPAHPARAAGPSRITSTAGRLDPRALGEEGVIRFGAALLARQAGRGIPRSALTGLTALTDAAGLEVTFLAGDPTIAVLRSTPGTVHRTQTVFTGLTDRERQVAELLADGMSNQQIAGELVVTLSTVKHHVHRILAKSGLPSRTAVAAAWRR